MNAIAPITISLSEFSGQDEHLVRRLFGKAAFWKRPWRLVDSIHQAQVVLHHVHNEGEWHAAQRFLQNRPDKILAVYAMENGLSHPWYLKKSANGRLSLLEFSQLLIKLGCAIDDGLLGVAAMSALVWEEKLVEIPIAAPDRADPVVALGIDLPEEGDEILPFLDMISTLLEGGREERKRFTDK